MSGPRVVILGLDGATLDVIRPWAATGLLPNLSRLMETGATGPLASTSPPITPLAWPSIFTGVNPGKHGIVGFEHRVPGEYRWKKASALDLLRPALWDLLEESGLRNGIFFVPYTFPAGPTGGWVVTGRGGPTGLQPGLSQPHDLATRLADRFGERELFGPRRPPGSNLGEIRDGLVRSIEAQSEAVAWAAKTGAFDLIFTVWDHTDTAAHLFWHWSEQPCPDEGSPMAEVYAAVDRGIGRVLEAVEGDPLVIVCSDHGAYPISLRVRVPMWLKEQGLLEIGGSLQSRSVAAAGRLWLRAPAALRQRVPVVARRGVGRVHERSFKQQSLIRWKSTSVYPQPISSEAFFLNLAGREPLGTVGLSEREHVLGRLERALADATSPEGVPIAEGSERGSAIFHGPRASDAPDLVAHAAKGVYFSPTAVGDTFSVPTRPKPEEGLPESLGYHDPAGVVIVAGPGVNPGEISGHSVTDITPTVLRYLDVPQPADLDGRAIAAAFHDLPAARTSDSPAERSQSPSEGLTEEQEADIEQQLRGLGYLE